MWPAIAFAMECVRRFHHSNELKWAKKDMTATVECFIVGAI